MFLGPARANLLGRATVAKDKVTRGVRIPLAGAGLLRMQHRDAENVLIVIHCVGLLCCWATGL